MKKGLVAAFVRYLSDMIFCLRKIPPRCMDAGVEVDFWKCGVWMNQQPGNSLPGWIKTLKIGGFLNMYFYTIGLDCYKIYM